MRLWSLHPGYLDQKGLTAVWREGLLAQAVLAGRTRGYTRHPQLRRFRESGVPLQCIAAYLRAIQAEAVRRGYRFDAGKIGPGVMPGTLPVSRGQLTYEWAHLIRKLRVRNPRWLARWRMIEHPRPHPLFRVAPGGIAPWESIKPVGQLTPGRRRPVPGRRAYVRG